MIVDVKGVIPIVFFGRLLRLLRLLGLLGTADGGQTGMRGRNGENRKQRAGEKPGRAPGERGDGTG